LPGNSDRKRVDNWQDMFPPASVGDPSSPGEGQKKQDMFSHPTPTQALKHCFRTKVRR
jgi:hypothetical protein